MYTATEKKKTLNLIRAFERKGWTRQEAIQRTRVSLQSIYKWAEQYGILKVATRKKTRKKTKRA